MLREVDGILRAHGTLGPERSGLPRPATIAGLVACAVVYGAVMGGRELRPLQMLYSATKVPLLVTVAAVLCLPNLAVVNTVLGLRADFTAVLRGLLLAQASICLALAALAPLTAFFYVSAIPYDLAIVFNGIMFLIAALAGQLTLARHYAPLIARNPKHRVARNAWLCLYVFVAIQMGWLLRPFVGDPGQATRFFRQGAWGNAYVELARIVWHAVN